MHDRQKPIELIHARNLLASISTPAYLFDARNALVYYNDAAANVMGRRFEETGPLKPEEWTKEFGPFTGEGEPMDIRELDTTNNLRSGRAAHAQFCIKSISGETIEIEFSALPIIGMNGFNGAMGFFWPLDDGAAG